MSLVFLFLLLADPQLQLSVPLDNRFQYINVVDASRIQIAEDGTIIALTPYTLWHWNLDGTLIRKLGQKGQGPGEFVFLLEAHWDGSHYWLMDGLNRMSSFYDADGNFLFRKPFFYRQFIPVGERMFVADYSGVLSYSDLLPPVLQEIQYTITENDINVQTLGQKFRKVTAQQRNYEFNFKKMWIATDQDALLVVDQLQPVMQVYSPDVLAMEAHTQVENPFEPPLRYIKAPRWVSIPEQFPKKGSLNQNEFRHWWLTWSRVTHFSNYGDDLLFAFETDSEDASMRSMQMIFRIDKNGVPVGEPLETYGYLVGAWNDLVYIFLEVESPEGFAYKLEAYKM